MNTYAELKMQEAALQEELAQSDAIYDIPLYNALAHVRSRLQHLELARDIRDQIATIEDIGVEK